MSIFGGNEKTEQVNNIKILVNYKSPRQDLVNEDLKVWKVSFPKRIFTNNNKRCLIG